MIRSLEIQNRQSHAHTKLDFHGGVNLIVGRGTSGKSAILRAFRWALENTSGESQISNWIKRTTKGKDPKKVLDGESAVTVTTPKGTLKRFRNTEASGYEVNGTTLKAVGTGVPPEVSDFFNISEVNIQGQFNPPFLISLPGSQVSAFLNRVAGIEEIDLYLTASTSCIREAKKARTSLLSDQKRDQRALDALSWVDGVQGQLDALDALGDAKSSKEARLQALQALTMSLGAEASRLAKASRVASLDQSFKEARRLGNAVGGVSTRMSGISRVCDGWKEAVEVHDKASRVAGLSGALYACVTAEAEATGASARLGRLATWAAGLRAVKESLTAAYKVARLSVSVSGVRSARDVVVSKEGRLGALETLVSRWSHASIVMRGCGRLAVLEPGLARVRKVSRVLASQKDELRALEYWLLTIQGVRDTLSRKRSEVSELEAKRPERCPLCGGAYGKECAK